MNRWRVVVGGVLMNLALGSLYAWSVFVAPLEKEFGWTRAETSLVFTIAVVTFAITFIFGGRLQDRRGPRPAALIGAVLVSLGFFLTSVTSSLTFLYLVFGVDRRRRQRLRLCDADAGRVEVVSRQARARRRADGGRLRRQARRSSGRCATHLIASIGWRATFQVLGVAFLAMGVTGAFLMANPPAGYRPEGWTPPAAAASRRDIDDRARCCGRRSSTCCGSRTASARRPG